MEQVLYSRKQLAERWGYPSTRGIEELENKGMLKRVPGLNGVRYNIKQIEKLENIGLDIDPLSPIERIKKDRRISNLEAELEKLNGILASIKVVMNNQ